VISTREVNRSAIREMFGNDLLKVYKAVCEHGDMKVSAKKQQANAFAVYILKELGFTPRQIREMIPVTYYMSRKDSFKISDSFKRYAMISGDFFDIVNNATDYSTPIPVSKRIVETLIVEDLAASGWSEDQIMAAVGVSRYKARFIINKIKDTDG